MSVSMAIGFLFLGGGQLSFGPPKGNCSYFGVLVPSLSNVHNGQQIPPATGTCMFLESKIAAWRLLMLSRGERCAACWRLRWREKGGAYKYEC